MNVLLKVPLVNIVFLIYSIGSWFANKNRKVIEKVKSKGENVKSLSVNANVEKLTASKLYVEI